MSKNLSREYPRQKERPRQLITDRLKQLRSLDPGLARERRRIWIKEFSLLRERR
jgi:hypothetical protein